MPDTITAPPAEWFQAPTGHTAAYDVQIEDDGRIHGYPAATWDSCHLSYDECVTPPRSATDYAYFKVGNIITADGSRVRTGPLTLKGGHADRNLSASKAMAFYDDTQSAFADVAIGEDQFGIWVAGAVRPDTTPEALRAAMGSGFSGDWRYIGDGFELIALSAVNTPGFRRRVDVHEGAGMVASMIVDMPSGDTTDEVIVSTTTETVHTPGVVDSDELLASMVDRIARSIGRSHDQRIDDLYSRVHGVQAAVTYGGPERRTSTEDRRKGDRRALTATQKKLSGQKAQQGRRNMIRARNNDRRTPEKEHS